MDHHSCCPPIIRNEPPFGRLQHILLDAVLVIIELAKIPPPRSHRTGDSPNNFLLNGASRLRCQPYLPASTIPTPANRCQHPTTTIPTTAIRCQHTNTTIPAGRTASSTIHPSISAANNANGFRRHRPTNDGPSSLPTGTTPRPLCFASNISACPSACSSSSSTTSRRHPSPIVSNMGW